MSDSILRRSDNPRLEVGWASSFAQAAVHMIAEPVLANFVDFGNSSFDFVLADIEEAHHIRH